MTTENWKQRFDEAVDDYRALKTKLNLNVLNLTKDITKEHLTYLGGFVEGEGSININIRRSKSTRFGLFVDPEFGLYQSVRSMQHLFTLWRYLKAGSLYFGQLKLNHKDETKHNSYEKASLRIGNRQDLIEKVIPFIKKYVIPHSGEFYKNRFERWCLAINLFNEQVHLSAEGMYEKMAPLVVELRAITPRQDATKDLSTVESIRGHLIERLKASFNEAEIKDMSDLDICKLYDKRFPPQKGGRS